MKLLIMKSSQAFLRPNILLNTVFLGSLQLLYIKHYLHGEYLMRYKRK